MYKRGKATPFLGSFHGSDVPEFYGSSGPNGTAPDFIGTDALGMFSNSKVMFIVAVLTRILSKLCEYWQPYYSTQF